MSRFASKTSAIYSHADPEIKRQAELILSQLGIPMSNAIDMYLRQIVIHRGIPFEMILPSNTPVSLGSLAKEEFDSEMQKGIDDITAGRVISADDVEKRLRSRYVR